MSRMLAYTTWGVIRVEADHGAVRACSLPGLSAEPGRPFVWRRVVIRADNAEDREVLEDAAVFLRNLLNGRKAAPPRIHWPDGSPFMRRVWQALAHLKQGECVAYGQLARRMGRPGRARAVGQACKANPLPLFIPCHRVVPKDGTLGGFSSGLPWKRLLLEREAKKERRALKQKM